MPLELVEEVSSQQQRSYIIRYDGNKHASRAQRLDTNPDARQARSNPHVPVSVVLRLRSLKARVRYPGAELMRPP